MIPSHKQKASKTPRVRRAANCGSTSRASWARGRITIRAPLVAVWPPWGQPTLPDLRCVRRRPRARTGTWTPLSLPPFPRSARHGTLLLSLLTPVRPCRTARRRPRLRIVSPTASTARASSRCVRDIQWTTLTHSCARRLACTSHHVKRVAGRNKVKTLSGTGHDGTLGGSGGRSGPFEAVGPAKCWHPPLPRLLPHARALCPDRVAYDPSHQSTTNP
jgi:hypothetical protein